MRVTVGITGASGSVYALRLIEEFCALNLEVLVVATDMAYKVCAYEMRVDLQKWLAERNLRVYAVDDLFAPPASGSYKQDLVVILPCSMGTLARVAQGFSGNLLERAADVALKERFPLILCPRETPLNLLHIENMLKATRAGAIIAPLTIGFYTKPMSLEDAINFHVGKLLDLMKLPHDLFVPWGSPKRSNAE